MNLKRVLTISSLITVCMVNTVMAAVPDNAIIIGSKAFEIPLLFYATYSKQIQEALDSSNGLLFYSLPGMTEGYIGLFDGQSISDSQKQELGSIEFIQLGGRRFKYTNFNDNDPQPIDEGGYEEELKVISIK